MKRPSPFYEMGSVGSHRLPWLLAILKHLDIISKATFKHGMNEYWKQQP